MINFLRRIRQRQLSENKFSKYLIYAIGEIILVVLGILMALQINTWNEQRKIKIDERQILDELKTSLEMDLKKINQCIAIYNTVKENLIKIKEDLTSDLPPSDSLGYNFAFSLFENSFEVNGAAYEALKSKGLNIISKTKIRKEIIALYENSYPWMTNAMRNTFINEGQFQEYCISLFDNVAYAELQGESADGVMLFKMKPLKPYDLEALKTDKKYRTLINTRIDQAEYLKSFYLGNTKRRVQKLIDDLELELSSDHPPML